MDEPDNRVGDLEIRNYRQMLLAIAWGRTGEHSIL